MFRLKVTYHCAGLRVVPSDQEWRMTIGSSAMSSFENSIRRQAAWPVCGVTSSLWPSNLTTRDSRRKLSSAWGTSEQNQLVGGTSFTRICPDNE